MSNNELDWDRPETWTGMIDRSPCGTGTCAVMAALHARGELALGQDFVHESIVGTQFVGRLLEETTVGEGSEAVNAVVPTISGQGELVQTSEQLFLLTILPLLSPVHWSYISFARRLLFPCMHLQL